jgi:hypothetical protein
MTEAREQEIRRIAERVLKIEDNYRALRECKKHVFSKQLGQTLTCICKNCGGEIEGKDAYWFAMGYDQAKEEQ